ncbi:MAG: phosphate ABC transporter ATP-binding protein [Thermodesulfovibrionales bacterium]|nr:phosphate ABC transporter ATP-binding protein [Thermodesulfovibrionales bacterium]
MNMTLRISNIYKSYNGRSVLKGCSFSFDRGGIYVLTGHNGSGKSTLLRICALLEPPDRGEINYLSGSNIIKKDTELKRRMTLVLPKVGVFNTTVFKNVAYGLKIRGIKGNKMEERVNKALDFVGLAHKKDQNALTLSSGETQRLGIARAMAIEPEILFLDEPTASVDMENTEIIENIILNMKRKDKSTIVITTHDMSQAERLGDTMLIMSEGRIIQG